MHYKRSSSQEQAKKDLRKKELTEAFKQIKANEGGPVTFYYTKEVETKSGKIKTVTESTRIVNLSPATVKHKNLSGLLVLLRSMQDDLNADYFKL